MKKIFRKIACSTFLVLLLGAVVLPVAAASAQTIYNSPYVSFSPDGNAWTTNAGDTDYTWYEEGTRVSTGISSSIRTLEIGEHYYKVDRTGSIPVGYWQVEHKSGTCIHDGYPGEEWHDIGFGMNKCEGYYYSGWVPYCADCGEMIVWMYFYMSENAAESIDYVEAGTGMDYYYLCPHCTNLEQGYWIKEHKCNSISWNRYVVKYEPNAWGNEGGYMQDSIHMYNNATVYEGEPVTPETHLRKNAYTRKGYEFVEWNTKPDGSGTSYADGAEIFNLTDEDYNLAQNKGIVTLYAQWRPSKSTLQIDPNGGTYQGSGDATSITQDFGTTYTVDDTAVVAPKGHTVSFETNGGEEIASITGTQHFVEWKRTLPFKGDLYNGIYAYIAPDGNVDKLTALYAPDAVTLPETSKEDSSFGGWYFDEEFMEPAGAPGDTVIPDEDITLYAQWVDLKLTAEDNYAANDRKGAVDLSWSQFDINNKSYLVYQSRDGENWAQINAAEDIGTRLNVTESFSFTGEVASYVVPYTGLYTLTAEGAQGGDYEDYYGGTGGRVTAQFWLQKGEVVTYNIGGQDGYNGGGTASMYGNGGGGTVVSTDLKGTILVAGGGGGATELGNGGDGGSAESVLETGIEGEDGGAGGGGGYRGGSAGEVVYHYHTALEEGETQNDCYVKMEGYDLADRSFYYNNLGREMHSVNIGTMSVDGHSAEEDDGPNPSTRIQLGSTTQLLDPEGASSVTIGLYGHGWSNLYYATAYEDMQLTVYDQDGNTLFHQKGFEGTGSQGAYSSTSTCEDSVTIALDETVTGIYIVSDREWQTSDAWIDHRITQVKFNDAIQCICLYEEGDIEKSYPAYGGSSYVNTDYSNHYSSDAGVKEGNGSFAIQSEKLGFMEALELNGVSAPDEEAPDMILLPAVEREPVGNDRVQIKWAEPEDKGTEYYHMVESFLNGSVNPLCQSNITLNKLVTGIWGYYCLVDAAEDTVVTDANGRFQTYRSMSVALSSEASYLHVAPVDVARNIGESTHIRIGSLEGGAEQVRWNLYTEQLVIDAGENIYPAGADKAYYVRSDGTTPFMLHYGAYMDGPAAEDYQLNYVIFESETEGVTSRNIFSAPSEAIQDAEIDIPMEHISYTAIDAPLLVRDAYTAITRKEKNKRLEAVQTFTLPAEASGKEICLTPVTGADYQGGTTYSDHATDLQNGLILIGDGEAPVITGLDILHDKELIDRRDGSIHLYATAADALSGVKDFYIKIHNTDNTIEKTYTPESDGSIRIEITSDEPIFSGDFTVTAYAVDNVGNARIEEYLTTEFSLKASVERMLEPHDPIFQAGESGILTITTWGYADRVEVEFPEEMTALDASLNKVYHYMDVPKYKQEEKLEFVVPLSTPENEAYVITVRAYKDGKELEAYPDLCTIEVKGTILDDFRTRLR